MKDYTKYSFGITLFVIAVMLAVTLVPPFDAFGVSFRRANILSDILTFDDGAAGREGGLGEDDMHFLEEADRLDSLAAVAAPADGAVQGQTWDLGGINPDGDAATGNGAAAALTDSAAVEFNDYTPEGGFSIADVSRVLEQASGERVVRVAFLGDSFIEGDIITGDVREQLQELYGGQGVGFVPMGNPLAISRPTVVHKFGGWTNHNLINKKSAPEGLQSRFFVSGTVSVPAGGAAWSEFRGTKFRKRLGAWSRARIIFANSADGTTIDVAVNDSITRQFTPAASGQAQQIELAGAGMSSLRVGVSSAAGFVGYGVVLEGARGVEVDNYAIRSNSGMAIFGTDAIVNATIGRMLGYDLVVLQWGLNAMDPEATSYNAYGTQLRRVINYVKACFPHSAVVVMSVGDRAVQREGEFVTAPAVEAMVAVQRSAAEACGVAFWNTYAAMGGSGSMGTFVERGWAAKDYTHLSYSGGRHIAKRFVAALVAAKNGRAASGFDNPGSALEPETVEELDLSRATGDSLKVGSNGRIADSTAVRRGKVVGGAQKADSVVNRGVKADSVAADSVITGIAADE